MFAELTPATQTKVKEIFKRLPPSSIEEVELNIERIGDEKLREGIRETKFDHSLEGALSASQDAFTKLRYLYEGTLSAGEGFTVGRVKNAVIEEIRNRHPEWFTPQGSSGTPPTSQAR